MATSSNNHQKWLRRAGLIVGLAGAIELTLFIFATSEGRFSWYSVPIVILPVSLLPLASGILFLLSRRGGYRG